MPATGRHSVILRPDSVKRVTPPTTMTAKTKADEPSNHIATGGGESTGSSAASTEAPEALEEKNRGSKVRCFFTTPERGRFCVHRPFARGERLLRTREVVRGAVCILRAGKGVNWTLVRFSPLKLDRSLVENPVEVHDFAHEDHSILLSPLRDRSQMTQQDGEMKRWV